MRRTIGGLALLAGGLFVVAEVVVARAWRLVPYSFSEHYISDLGITQCVDLGSRVVCSPLHGVMNAAFVGLGVLTALGAVLLAPMVRRRWRGAVLGAACVHAVGVVTVGLFPGSVVEAIGGDARQMLVHSAGSGLAIGGGTVAILLTGAATRRDHPHYAVACAVVGSLGATAIALHTLGVDLGLGPGGSQRLTVYPIPVWLVLTGAAVLAGGRVTARRSARRDAAGRLRPD